MYCSKCGFNVSDNSNYCPKCGAKLNNFYENSSFSNTNDNHVNQNAAQNYNEIKESDFKLDNLYDRKYLETFIFLCAIIRFMVNAIDLELTGEYQNVPFYKLNYIEKLFKLAGIIPEEIIQVCTLCLDVFLVYLLMKAFSNLHKPLKGWFIPLIFCSILIDLVDTISSDTDELDIITLSLLLSVFIAYIITYSGLAISIIINYEGKIKAFGFISLFLLFFGIAFLFVDLSQTVSFYTIFFTDWFYDCIIVGLLFRKTANAIE